MPDLFNQVSDGFHRKGFNSLAFLPAQLDTPAFCRVLCNEFIFTCSIEYFTQKCDLLPDCSGGVLLNGVYEILHLRHVYTFDWRIFEMLAQLLQPSTMCDICGRSKVGFETPVPFLRIFRKWILA